jgi:hypothetical protein
MHYLEKTTTMTSILLNVIINIIFTFRIEKHLPSLILSVNITFESPGLQRSIQQSGSYGRLVRAGSADSLLSRSNSNINSPRALVHEKYGLCMYEGLNPKTLLLS